MPKTQPMEKYNILHQYDWINSATKVQTKYYLYVQDRPQLAKEPLYRIFFFSKLQQIIRGMFLPPPATQFEPHKSQMRICWNVVIRELNQGIVLQCFYQENAAPSSDSAADFSTSEATGPS